MCINVNLISMPGSRNVSCTIEGGCMDKLTRWFCFSESSNVEEYFPIELLGPLAVNVSVYSGIKRDNLVTIGIEVRENI